MIKELQGLEESPKVEIYLYSLREKVKKLPLGSDRIQGLKIHIHPREISS